MTEEQIKQNAEEYADKNCVFDYNSVENYAVMNAFIAGAHSLDEEIDELITYYENELAINQHVIDKLRNPWISVEERLPERIHNDCDYSVECLIHCYDKEAEWNTVAQYNYAQHCWDLSDYDYSYETVVQFWIPIPELKKEE